MKQFILLAIASLFILSTSFAQIQELKDGVLVVFLQSDSRKIEALEEALEKTPSNKNLERQLVKTQIESKRTNEAIMAAFEQEYSFSEVLFTYDISAKAMKTGEREGIFLNKSLEVDENLNIGDRFFAMLKSGKSVSGAEGFQILNEKFESFPEPFPQFIRLSTLSYLMNTIFADDIADGKLYSRLAKKTQKRFENFALRAR